MKRTAFLSIALLAAAGAAYSQDLADFQTGFTAFSGDLAATLSYNATVGNNWSDAYVGGFPRFGVGVAIGATAVPADSLSSLFAAMGLALPAELTQYGLPIPAAALSAKIGGFILPFDVGLKAMVVPDQLGQTLADAGINLDYTLFGGNVRFALVKEKLLLPDVSIGAGFNRLNGSVGMDLDVATPSFAYTDPYSVDHVIALTQPALSLGWTTDSYDFTLQVSKSLLFIRPYAGIGYSLGKSTVSGGLLSSLTYDGVAITPEQLAEINAALSAAGQATAQLSADGVLFGAESVEPVLRVYGGASLELLILKLDLSATYVPATGSLGAQAMVRIQF